MTVYGSLALKKIQDKPFLLTIVEKPAPICPSALRESKARWQKGERVFEEKGRTKEISEVNGLAQQTMSSTFQDIATGQTYHLRVVMNVIENQVFTASFINGRAISTQEYLINAQSAGRSMGTLANEEQALLGAFDYLQSLVMRGKA